MKFVQLVGAAGMAGAVALPAAAPDLDADFLAAILAAPTPKTLGPEPDVYSSTVVSYNPTTVTAVVQSTITPDPTADAVKKRSVSPADKCASNGWDCCPLPTGTLAVPDTAAAFTTYAAYASLATGASTPSNYQQAFSNLNGATQQVGYRGVFTLDSYDPSVCAAKCDADSDCQAFNIYIERDPVLRPDYDVCQNPDATANIKCTLYGYPVHAETATNAGQYQGQFQILVAASNGYNKPYTAPTLDNFNAPVGPLNGAIEDSHYYLYELYNDGPFSPASCAKGCQANTAWNKAHANNDGTYTACNFFNAYILYRDNNPVGTVCSYYSADIADPASKATNVGQYQGDVHVTVGESYTYTLTTQDNGGVSPVSSTGCANPGVCGTYQIWWMDNGGDAACGLDPDGNALCFVDMSCYGTPTCSTNSDCTGGAKCLTQSCCGFSLCATPTTVCANSASKVKRALMGAEKRRAASTRRSDSDACTALSCPSSSS